MASICPVCGSTRVLAGSVGDRDRRTCMECGARWRDLTDDAAGHEYWGPGVRESEAEAYAAQERDR